MPSRLRVFSKLFFNQTYSEILKTAKYEYLANILVLRGALRRLCECFPKDQSILLRMRSKTGRPAFPSMKHPFPRCTNAFALPVSVLSFVSWFKLFSLFALCKIIWNPRNLSQFAWRHRTWYYQYQNPLRSFLCYSKSFHCLGTLKVKYLNKKIVRKWFW
jgi:hypothetical protein